MDLDGERIDIRARIETLGGYSAHADQNGLPNFAMRMRHGLSEICLAHGESGAKQQLAGALKARYISKQLTVKIST